MTPVIHVGDCLDVTRQMEANSVDAIVTDPPYHLSDPKRGAHVQQTCGMKTKRTFIVWTPSMDALLGTMPDRTIGMKFGFSELPAMRRRKELTIPSFRSTKGPVSILCATCGIQMERKLRDTRRSQTLFCSTQCAAAGQKRRDSDMLRYGTGWRNRRAEVLARDKVCRSCGKTPAENGRELHVHHLKPFRFRGTNHPSNLVALCDSCHHKIEAITEQTLSSISIDVSLVGSSLTIVVDGAQRWPAVLGPCRLPELTGQRRAE